MRIFLTLFAPLFTLLLVTAIISEAVLSYNNYVSLNTKNRCNVVIIDTENTNWMKLMTEETSQAHHLNITLSQILLERGHRIFAETMKAHSHIRRAKEQSNQVVVVGVFSLPVAGVAEELGVPYVVMSSFYPQNKISAQVLSISVGNADLAIAAIDILHMYKARKVAVIIEGQFEFYDNFLRTFFQDTSVELVIRALDLRQSNINHALQGIQLREITDIVVYMTPSSTEQIMEKARWYSMISFPYRWIILSDRCISYRFGETITHIKTNITIICDEGLHQSTNHNKTLASRFLSLIEAGKFSDSYRKVMSNISLSENITLAVQKLWNAQYIQIGNWRKDNEYVGSGRLHYHALSVHNASEELTAAYVLRVVGVEEHPHLISNINGSEFQGFGVDLLHALSQKLNFQYVIQNVPRYGSKEDGWDGAIGMLLNASADMTIGPLVQSPELEEVIDFSTPFKQRELSLVIRKPYQKPRFFQFLYPFENYVWYCVLGAIVVLSISVWAVESLCAKFDRRKTDFSLLETTWFVFATTVQGSSDLQPRSIPGRIMVGTFYLFVLILITSYTANLAAFLTVKKLDSGISDIADLAMDNKFKFGTVRGSNVLEYFEHSKTDTFKTIFNRMHNVRPEWLVDSSAEGYQRCRDDDYVFIWDDSVNEYELFIESDKCDLTIVGRPFGKRSLAIGIPQSSNIKEKMNKALLELIDQNVINQIEFKWWQQRAKCSRADNSNQDAEDLSLSDLAGVFLTLVAGSVVAFLAMGFSAIYNKLCGKVKKQTANECDDNVALQHICTGNHVRRPSVINDCLSQV